jgi:iron complex outermembrane receptor protein
VFDLTSKLALTMGIRYTDEKRSLLFNQPPVLVSERPIISAETRSDWRLGLDYRFNDARFVYGSIATGFRGAGFQPRPWTPGQVLPFDQEEVVTTEIGFKGDFLERRLRMNIAAFSDDYDPRVLSVSATQCNEFDNPDPGRPFFEDDLVQPGDLCPAGTPMAGTVGFRFSPYISAPGTVNGVELELQANPFGQLTLTYSAGLNRFRSKTSDPTDLAYRHPDKLLQPEVNQSASVQYSFRLPGGGTLSPRVDWVYQGHNTNGDPSTPPEPGNIIPSYALLHARLTFDSPDGAWQTSVAVRNLTDEFYWNDFLSPGGFAVAGSPGTPRQWSVAFRRSF